MRMLSALLAAALWLAVPTPGRAADPIAEEAARSYRVETGGTTGALAKGATGKLVLAIVPLSGTHVHPEAPLEIALTATAGVALSKAVLGHADAQARKDPKAEAPRFEVPFTATAAGAQELRARLDFYICSDRWCVKHTRDVAVAIDVK